MRVLVTGAGGFVGSRLLPRLQAQGHDTIGTDRDVDVTDFDAVCASIAGAAPDAIIHLAAQSSVATSLRDPAETIRINYVGAHTLLAATLERAPEARVVLVGSGDVYPLCEPAAPPLRESDGLAPRSPYARSKAAAELLAGIVARECDLDVVATRSFNHTGAGQETRFVAPDFAHQIAEIEAGLRPPEMRVGNLESVRDFLHVDDVVEAYVRLLDPSVPARIYNICSGTGTRIGELLGLLCELAGVKPCIETDPERYRPTDSLVGDASLLRAATGWSPRITLRETLEELLDDWRERIADAG